jgi:hypothetical protein
MWARCAASKRVLKSAPLATCSGIVPWPLSATGWNRLYKVSDGAYIYFGQKEYIPAFDALLTRNTYGLHTIRLIWKIPVNERYIIITPGGLSKVITADEAALI